MTITNRFYSIMILLFAMVSLPVLADDDINFGVVKITEVKQEIIVTDKAQTNSRKQIGDYLINSHKQVGTAFVGCEDKENIYIFTAAHVLGEGKIIDVNIKFWKFDNPILAKFLVRNMDDIAILRIEKNHLPDNFSVLSLALSSSSLNENDDFTIIGHPSVDGKSLEWDYTNTTIKSLVGNKITFEKKLVDSGSSGSPVIRGGQIVGMVTKVGESAYAVPVEYLNLMLRGKKGVECKNEYLENVVARIEEGEKSVGQSKIEQFFEDNDFSQGNSSRVYLQQADVNRNRINIDLELIHYHTTGVSKKIKNVVEFLSGEPFNENRIKIYNNVQPFSFDFHPNNLNGQICVLTNFLGTMLERKRCVLVRDFMAVIDMESQEFNAPFFQARTDMKEKKPIQFEEGMQGKWGEWQYCPDGSFATGYAMKTAVYTHVDNTATNGIRLYCEKKIDNESHLEKVAIITSNVGWKGYLRASKFCKNSQFLQSFNVKSEEYNANDKDVCDRDYSAINSLLFYCTGADNEKIEAPRTMYWGHWQESPKACPSDSAICGIQTRTGILSKKNQDGNDCEKDNVGLNGVKFACCSLPN